uniref:Endonuclease/exonuclease/phosphatase domain-containing protein n=1 Tax=Sus scrofa TaxID=9823 RepID=A0A8D0N2I7_PIG
MVKGKKLQTRLLYPVDKGSPQYIRQLLTTLKGEIDNSIIIVGDFNTPLRAMDRSSRKKINKETQALNDALDQMGLIDIYRTFHPKRKNCKKHQHMATKQHATKQPMDHSRNHRGN